MNNKYANLQQKEENKLLIAKLEDKLKLCNTKNKVTYSDFMQINEKSIAIKYLKQNQISNYFFFGGRDNSDREILVFYPDKIDEKMAYSTINKYIKVVRIRFDNQTLYSHGEYLSGIMKLGIVREKFGDIIVTDFGADIIAFKEVAEYFANNLKLLTRFRNADVSVAEIDELINVANSFEELSIIVSSPRLDNFVSELGKFSRANASEFIQLGKVFVNGVNEFKDSKKIILNDIITIRGKGKFIVKEFVGKTRNDRIRVEIKKYA